MGRGYVGPMGKGTGKCREPNVRDKRRCGTNLYLAGGFWQWSTPAARHRRRWTYIQQGFCQWSDDETGPTYSREVAERAMEGSLVTACAGTRSGRIASRRKDMRKKNVQRCGSYQNPIQVGLSRCFCSIGSIAGGFEINGMSKSN
ncbi:unnamed protein product [Urochloa humidicola]